MDTREGIFLELNILTLEIPTTLLCYFSVLLETFGTVAIDLLDVHHSKGLHFSFPVLWPHWFQSTTDPSLLTCPFLSRFLASLLILQWRPPGLLVSNSTTHVLCFYFRKRWSTRIIFLIRSILKGNLLSAGLMNSFTYHLLIPGSFPIITSPKLLSSFKTPSQDLLNLSHMAMKGEIAWLFSSLPLSLFHIFSNSSHFQI